MCRSRIYARRPPFSYALFVLACAEALLWFAPLQLLGDEAESNFSTTLCAYLSRESVNLKQTTQRWRVVGIEEQEEYGQLHRLRIEASAGKNCENKEKTIVPLDFELLSKVPMATNIATQLGRGNEQPRRLFYAADSTSGKKQPLSAGDDSDPNPSSTINSIAVKLSLYIRLFLSVVCFLVLKQGHMDKWIGFCVFAIIATPGCTATELSLTGLTGEQSTVNNERIEDIDSTVCTNSDFPCSGHGLCQASICVCDAGWTGPQCEKSEVSVPRSANNLFIDVVKSKVVIVCILVSAGMVYLLVCWWLSVGFLRLVTRIIYRAPKSLSDRDLEAQIPIQHALPRVFVNEQDGASLANRIPPLVRDFRFKTHVLHDALLTYSNIMNPACGLFHGSAPMPQRAGSK